MFSDVLVDPITKAVYHLEDNPEDGSCVIVDTDSGRKVLPDGYSARDAVNEYGGAPAIAYSGIVYFSNQADNSIYAVNVNDDPPVAQQVTPGTNTPCHP